MSNRNDHTHTKIISSAEELISLFRQCNDNISILHQYSSDDFIGLNASIRHFHRQATSILQTAAAIAEKNSTKEEVYLSELPKQSLYTISAIVTKLQFHDIIRQKLEHIQDTNQHIIEELLVVNNKVSKSPAHLQNTYISIIPDIIRLHVAQLKDTDATYKQTFAEIKSYLKVIKESNLSSAEAYTDYFNRTVINQASKQLSERVISHSQKFASQISEALVAIKHCRAFNTLLNETCWLLTNCTIQLPLLKTDATIDNHTQTLKNLEFLYTMESERIVLNQVLKGGQLSDLERSQPQGDDENTELF